MLKHKSLIEMLVKDTVKMRNMLLLSATEDHTLADPALLRRGGGSETYYLPYFSRKARKLEGSK